MTIEDGHGIGVDFRKGHPCNCLSLRAAISSMAGVQFQFFETNECMNWRWDTHETSIVLAHWIGSTMAGQSFVRFQPDHPKMRAVVEHWERTWPTAT